VDLCTWLGLRPRGGIGDMHSMEGDEGIWSLNGDTELAAASDEDTCS